MARTIVRQPTTAERQTSARLWPGGHGWRPARSRGSSTSPTSPKATPSGDVGGSISLGDKTVALSAKAAALAKSREAEIQKVAAQEAAEKTARQEAGVRAWMEASGYDRRRLTSEEQASIGMSVGVPSYVKTSTETVEQKDWQENIAEKTGLANVRRKYITPAFEKDIRNEEVKQVFLTSKKAQAENPIERFKYSMDLKASESTEQNIRMGQTFQEYPTRKPVSFASDLALAALTGGGSTILKGSKLGAGIVKYGGSAALGWYGSSKIAEYVQAPSPEAKSVVKGETAAQIATFGVGMKAGEKIVGKVFPKVGSRVEAENVLGRISKADKPVVDVFDYPGLKKGGAIQKAGVKVSTEKVGLDLPPEKGLPAAKFKVETPTEAVKVFVGRGSRDFTGVGVGGKQYGTEKVSIGKNDYFVRTVTGKGGERTTKVFKGDKPLAKFTDVAKPEIVFIAPEIFKMGGGKVVQPELTVQTGKTYGKMVGVSLVKPKLFKSTYKPKGIMEFLVGESLRAETVIPKRTLGVDIPTGKVFSVDIGKTKYKFTDFPAKWQPFRVTQSGKAMFSAQPPRAKITQKFARTGVGRISYEMQPSKVARFVSKFKFPKMGKKGGLLLNPPTTVSITKPKTPKLTTGLSFQFTSSQIKPPKGKLIPPKMDMNFPTTKTLTQNSEVKNIQMPQSKISQVSVKQPTSALFAKTTKVTNPIFEIPTPQVVTTRLNTQQVPVTIQSPTPKIETNLFQTLIKVPNTTINIPPPPTIEVPPPPTIGWPKIQAGGGGVGGFKMPSFGRPVKGRYAPSIFGLELFRRGAKPLGKAPKITAGLGIRLPVVKKGKKSKRFWYL